MSLHDYQEEGVEAVYAAWAHVSVSPTYLGLFGHLRKGKK